MRAFFINFCIALHIKMVESLLLKCFSIFKPKIVTDLRKVAAVQDLNRTPLGRSIIQPKPQELDFAQV